MISKSDELLDGVGGFIATGAWDLDLTSNKLLWSAETCTIHGVPPGFQPTLETATAFFAQEARAVFSDAITQAVSGGRPWNLELPLIRADGRRIWVRSIGGAVIEDGASVRLSGVLQDVTAHIAERQALLDANERLMLAIQAGGIGIWDWDVVNNQMVWDSRMYELYGRCPGPTTETVAIWRSSLHPDDRARAERALQDSLCGLAPFETVFRIVWSDGSVHHIRGAGLVTRDAAGRPLRMLGSNWDITAKTLIITERVERELEKKAADIELEQVANQVREAENLTRLVKREKDRFRAAIDAVQGVFWTNGASGRMEGEQPGWAAVTGQDLHEYQGHGWALAVHPDDAQPTLDAWNQAVAERRTFVFEHRVRRFDGCWRSFAIRAVPLLDPEDGSVLEWVGVHTDITEQREAEAALRRANTELNRVADEFRALADGMAELCWMGEPDGHIYWYNRRWYDYTGKSAAEMEEWGWQSVHDPQTLLRVLESWQASIATGSDFEMTFPLRGADGVFRLFLTRVAPIFGSDGKVKRWLGTSVDVSELNETRKKLEERVRARTAELEGLARHLTKARDAAERANQAKSRFLAGMSHELRTPLNGILGYARLLQMEGGLNPKQEVRLNTMVEAGKHLLHMITRVLDLSEIESEHTELQITEFDIREVAETCLEIIHPLAEAKGLVPSFTVASGTPRKLLADVTRLRQVLLNLLGNAVKFTSRGTIAMRLRSSADGSALRIEVADTGPGVPAEKRGRLFQEFERLDAEATRATEGSGLGLSLSARLAGMLGGRLGYEDNPGGGSLFWLELPINASVITVASPPDESDASSAPPLSSKLRVLVVDDVFMNREIAGSFLSAAGHQITYAGGGAEAVAAVARTDFDVVLMDVRMPEVDGLEATRRIRALEGKRGQVPIVALTAQAFTEQIAACREAGMDTHLAKPFEMDELRIAVTRAVAVGTRLGGTGSSAPAQITMLATSSIDAELPMLDLVVFERTAVHLAPEATVAYLRTIAELGETLLRRLHESAALTESGDPLIALVHKLVGSAGMFGFERLAAAGRVFEQALQSNAPDTAVLAGRMDAATAATCQEIYARTA